MADSKPSEVTQILARISAGDRSGIDELAPLVYQELRKIARRLLARERPDHSLQPTELLHEAFIKLAQQDRVSWQGRSHFLGVGAHHMRRILVDHARTKLSAKRGSAPRRVELTEDMMLTPRSQEDVVAIDDALEKLKELDEHQARVVELRFFGGLTVKEVAEVLGVPKRTVETEWTLIRAWLRRELTRSDTDAVNS